MFFSHGELSKPYTGKDYFQFVQITTEHLFLFIAAALIWKWIPVSTLPFLEPALYAIFAYPPTALLVCLVLFARAISYLEKPDPPEDNRAIAREVSRAVFREQNLKEIPELCYKIAGIYAMLILGIWAQSNLLVNAAIIGGLFHCITITVIIITLYQESQEIRRS